ncbi:hypothetical protein APZ24_gp045 [Ostreococcus lucimarinus virus 2]|jgi:hypothetical protein|uniref:hypothetical protein n=2 Tax=unclassified Prasinovirus TaxID=880158 RepID=UPI0001EF47FB|nr:hypothetical protein OtV2_039 [Ostreococcus tauri virus 2]YP_009172536.1 hypothetical protein APZ24_gp045 [Ostreococcus lucimarinus virus 2]ALI95408.1 hypothetical protein OlV2_045 [Ostreococcus lucimarinus virus 2]CBI70038.1 hypothetical protein OtV2_039 [Ostreococcus tauri virus 2]|tara:strand:+ start:180 stop:602 length:423 start_codon:yes stop_codon:yes gene_type:complete
MQWQQPHYSRPFLIYVNIIKMDLILEKFSGKIDAKGVITMVEDIKREYLGDGLQKEDIPPIVAKLMINAAKFDKLEGPQKKKLVVAILNHLIGEIDGDAEHDSEFEIVLKSMVPAMVDGFAGMLKAKQAIGKLFSCCIKA